jgi:DNA-binding transcriptional regulator YdaS (Cro superfamily)
MDNRDTYQDTLTYALAIAGGEQELAEHLRVSARQLDNWLKGVDPVPERIFHAALDLVIGSSRQAIHRSRGLIQRIAR